MWLDAAGRRRDGKHMAHDTPVLAAKNLQKAFPSEGEHHLFHRRMNAAVSDVSFEIYPGETLGLRKVHGGKTPDGVGKAGCWRGVFGGTAN